MLSWLPFLDDAKDYLVDLKTVDGSYLYDSKWKTPILGYLLMIESVKSLFHLLLEGEQPTLRYHLTYQFSQDHLELFFSSVRGQNGWNNNPAFCQFKTAYRGLLHLHDDQGIVKIKTKHLFCPLHLVVKLLLLL